MDIEAGQGLNRQECVVTTAVASLRELVPGFVDTRRAQLGEMSIRLRAEKEISTGETTYSAHFLTPFRGDNLFNFLTALQDGPRNRRALVEEWREVLFDPEANPALKDAAEVIPNVVDQPSEWAFVRDVVRRCRTADQAFNEATSRKGSPAEVREKYGRSFPFSEYEFSEGFGQFLVEQGFWRPKTGRRMVDNVMVLGAFSRFPEAVRLEAIQKYLSQWDNEVRARVVEESFNTKAQRYILHSEQSGKGFIATQSRGERSEERNDDTVSVMVSNHFSARVDMNGAQGFEFKVVTNVMQPTSFLEGEVKWVTDRAGRRKPDLSLPAKEDVILPLPSHPTVQVEPVTVSKQKVPALGLFLVDYATNRELYHNKSVRLSSYVPGSLEDVDHILKGEFVYKSEQLLRYR